MTVWRFLIRIRQAAVPLPFRGFLVSPLFVTILVAALLGATSGEVVARAGTGDRVVVGNTGGSLSAVIQVNGSLVVLGGGNARTDLADLLGRSTVPWRRHVSALIVPGWDDQQMVGALGLVERGGVKQLIILGTPTDSAVSHALQQAAAERAIPLSAVTGRNAIDLGNNVSLELESAQPSSDATPEYTLVTLLYFQSRLTFLDASKDGLKAMTRDGIVVARTHVLIETRALADLAVPSDVLLQPRADAATSFASASVTYVGEVNGGQHITLQLSEHEIRLPLSQVSANVATPVDVPATP